MKTIDDLCQALVRELSQDPTGKRVVSMLREYAETCDDWRQFVNFDSSCYTRNLIHRCGDYELLLLCWDAGQESPIHDHSGQNCWMAVLEGDLEEVHYRQAAPGEPLVEGKRTSLGRGGVAYIQDEIALHLIRPTGGRGISLHLYAKAIDACKIFDPSNGDASDIEVGYYSVRGERCTRSPEAVRAEFA